MRLNLLASLGLLALAADLPVRRKEEEEGNTFVLRPSLSDEVMIDPPTDRTSAPRKRKVTPDRKKRRKAQGQARKTSRHHK